MSDPYESPTNRLMRKIITLVVLISILTLVAIFAITSGCITASKQAYADFTATPAPTPTPPPPTPEPTPQPEPTPELSQEQVTSLSGGLMQGQWYVWDKTNVSGQKDLTMHVSVYDYRIFNSVEWRSVSWGQNFREGAGDGMKFLFAFVRVYSDTGDSTTWGIQPDQFFVNVNETMFEVSDQLLPEIRITNFDEIWDYSHVENIKPYGFRRTYNNEGRETAEPLGYLKPGKSQAWDGYIVFAIPRETQPENIKIFATFGNLTENKWWQLTKPNQKQTANYM